MEPEIVEWLKDEQHQFRKLTGWEPTYSALVVTMWGAYRAKMSEFAASQGEAFAYRAVKGLMEKQDIADCEAYVKTFTEYMDRQRLLGAETLTNPPGVESTGPTHGADRPVSTQQVLEFVVASFSRIEKAMEGVAGAVSDLAGGNPKGAGSGGGATRKTHRRKKAG